MKTVIKGILYLSVFLLAYYLTISTQFEDIFSFLGKYFDLGQAFLLFSIGFWGRTFIGKIKT